MEKILDKIAALTYGKSYKTAKFSYDKVGGSGIEYEDADDVDKINWEEDGETKPPKSGIYDLTSDKDKIIKNHVPSIFTYFLDGSRHVFKVDDIAYQNSIYPIVAGQIGVGCCRRVDREMHQFRLTNHYVISLPDQANYGMVGTDEEFFKNICGKLNETELLKHRFSKKIQFNKILSYRTGIKGANLENLAISQIQSYMIEQEKKMVIQMAKDKLLDQDHYMIKDGSLQYQKPAKSKTREEKNNIRGNFDWVIGVSKSFNPAFCKGRKNKSYAQSIADLPVDHRTAVQRFSDQRNEAGVPIGIWYIRIRDNKIFSRPFDGVLKIEKIMTDSEINQGGIDTDLINTISAHLLLERTPTCYGKDARWANHLYPVYLTESFVKSHYLSADMFLQLF